MYNYVDCRMFSSFTGRIHSSGTTRGYCIVFDDPRRDRVWKRAKSLRVISELVVKQGRSKDV
jgi:hypothetical protein